MAHVFMSHVSEDRKEVDRLCEELTKHGVQVWLYRKDIAPGTRWKQAVRRAISEGAFFIACFSKEYNQREKMYMNEELIIAIEELRKRPRDRAWFIPVKLSECEIPDWDIGAGETLRDIQWVDMSSSWEDGVQKIQATISPQFGGENETPSREYREMRSSLKERAVRPDGTF